MVNNLLRLNTIDFELTIWTRDISRSRRVFKKTIDKRSLKNHQINLSRNIVKLEPFDKTLRFIYGENSPIITLGSNSEFELPSPYFFENTEYHIEWEFFTSIDDAYLTHRNRSINDGFRFSPARDNRPARLSGTIRTGNNIGWMRLPLVYKKLGESHQSQLSFEVLATKMLMHEDLPTMYQTIDESFPLWRFNLVSRTEQDAGHENQRGNFPLMWLANFSRLRQSLELALKIILRAPHSRLQSHISYCKAARLKGKIPHKIGSAIKEDFANGLYNRRYRVEKKSLDVNTPENRFIKMVISKTKKQLAQLEQKLRHSNVLSEQPRLSEAFLNELYQWQQPLNEILTNSFLSDLGDYNGTNHESLVLQQKPGYSSVYRIWNELKLYLDAFSDISSISMKSVAEIYEVWCFLRIKQILEDELEFQLINTKLSDLYLNPFFELQLRDGYAGAFEFKRHDGVIARLAHEPRFTKNTKRIRSYLVSQEPDILLEVSFPKSSESGDTNKQFIWLFDAKYRIKTETNRYDNEDIDQADYVPDDAINQMHRYRDALILLNNDQQTNKKSRPVLGAFALYPGFFDQTETNYYAEAIKEIGIGAFALLPDADGQHSKWLVNFLREQIGVLSHQNLTDNLVDRLYTQDAARIPYHGMRQVLYSDLTMTAALGRSNQRETAYFDAFKNGTAKWYHMPQSTFAGVFKQHIVDEIRYLALASTFKHNQGNNQIEKIWPVKSVTLRKRSSLTIEQTGKASNSVEMYYLFELGQPLTLYTPMTLVPDSFIDSMTLTTLNSLEQTKEFHQIQRVYEDALQVPSLSNY